VARHDGGEDMPTSVGTPVRLRENAEDSLAAKVAKNAKECKEELPEMKSRSTQMNSRKCSRMDTNKFKFCFVNIRVNSWTSMDLNDLSSSAFISVAMLLRALRELSGESFSRL
jgi:hypothetical protein